jgi:hypothetical protein
LVVPFEFIVKGLLVRDTKESLKEEITTLRDDNKNLFVVFMATLTGIFTVLFRLLTDSKLLEVDFISIYNINALVSIGAFFGGFILAFILLGTVRKSIR